MSIFKKYRSSKGFTLIELLVVIAIIGVLATLILLQLGVARSKARDAKRIADVNQLRTAVELYFDDNGGSYPGAALCAPAGASCTSGSTGGNLTDYLGARVLPKDPLLSSQDYYYAWSPSAAGNKTRYHIYAELERKNAPAFNGDVDINSAGGTWGATGAGNTVDASLTTVEDCTVTTITPPVSGFDCIYDLGQN